MFCSKCGKEVQVGTKFCPYCGNKVGVVDQTSAVNEEAKVETPHTVVMEETEVATPTTVVPKETKAAAPPPFVKNQTRVVTPPPFTQENVKVVVDPNEVMDSKKVVDSSKSFSGFGKVFGIILMLLSIIGDLATMFIIGFDAFIPVSIGATVLFVIGFLMTIFSH